MQGLMVCLVVAAAVAYAAWRIYGALRHGGDPCRGCQLADACAKRGASKGKSSGCQASKRT